VSACLWRAGNKWFQSKRREGSWSEARQGTGQEREREREREGLVRGSTCVWRVLAAEWERNGGAMTRKNGGERGSA